MDPSLLGLNVLQMRTLVAGCQREASAIRSTVQQLQRVIDSTWWQGPDADTFRRQWEAEHRRKSLDVAQDLDQLASFLAHHADKQEVTSQR
jgi:uncharacterized protein YukE